MCPIRLGFWISFKTISLRRLMSFIPWLLLVLVPRSFIRGDRTVHSFEIYLLYLLFSFKIHAVSCSNYQLIIQVNLHFFLSLGCRIISTISFNQHVFFQKREFLETHDHQMNLTDHKHFVFGFILYILPRSIF